MALDVATVKKAIEAMAVAEDTLMSGVTNEEFTAGMREVKRLADLVALHSSRAVKRMKILLVKVEKYERDLLDAVN